MFAITFYWSVRRTCSQRLWVAFLMLFLGIPHLTIFFHICPYMPIWAYLAKYHDHMWRILRHCWLSNAGGHSAFLITVQTLDDQEGMVFVSPDAKNIDFGSGASTPQCVERKSRLKVTQWQFVAILLFRWLLFDILLPLGNEMDCKISFLLGGYCVLLQVQLFLWLQFDYYLCYCCGDRQEMTPWAVKDLFCNHHQQCYHVVNNVL